MREPAPAASAFCFTIVMGTLLAPQASATVSRKRVVRGLGCPAIPVADALVAGTIGIRGPMKRARPVRRWAVI